MSNQPHDILFSCRRAHKDYSGHQVLHDINLELAYGQILGIIGKSGCGKSTLLNMILGTLTPSSGALYMDEGGHAQRITRPSADRGAVFQKYDLYPFLTVEENVARGPDLLRTNLFNRTVGIFSPWSKWRKVCEEEIVKARIILEKMELGEHLEKYPSDLSGGMQQRVALAQALSTNPRLIVLDEPFGALDEDMRETLQRMLLEFYQVNIQARRQGKKPPYTIIIVTHEIREALFVADRVIGLSPHWNWKQAGFQKFPGATIVYDKSAPIFDPTISKDEINLSAQHKEIREVVCSGNCDINPKEYVTFFQEMNIQPKGVLAP